MHKSRKGETNRWQFTIFTTGLALYRTLILLHVPHLLTLEASIRRRLKGVLMLLLVSWWLELGLMVPTPLSCKTALITLYGQMSQHCTCKVALQLSQAQVKQMQYKRLAI